MEQQAIELSAEMADMLDLGDVLGQHRTLAAVAGRCSAAQAATLCRLREEKLYKRCTPSWDDFCTNHLKMCRPEVDRTIRLWQEFGPAYFELSQLTRISPETYRAIAPMVKDGALHHNGEVIPVTAENARRVASTVADLRRALPAPARSACTPEDRVAALDHRCTEIAAEFRELAAMDRSGVLWRKFESVVSRWQRELHRIGQETGIR